MSGFPKRFAIASRNPGKIREIKQICAAWPVAWVTAGDEGHPPWPVVEETGATYKANALLKARAVTGALALPVVADDSGIEVDALGGGPGPRSARYAGENATDAENLKELIRAIAGIPAVGRAARYRCVAVATWPDGRHLEAEATCDGTLVAKARGDGGFGYDPIFVPAGWDETMAELTVEQKDRISHRGKAFRALAELIDKSRAEA